MRELRKCTKCSLYSFSLRRCKRGQINPRTRKGAIEAASIMGVEYVCDYAKWKDAVVEHLGRDYEHILPSFLNGGRI